MAEDTVAIAVPVEAHPDHPLHLHHHEATRENDWRLHGETREVEAGHHEATRSHVSAEVDRAVSPLSERLAAIDARLEGVSARLDAMIERPAEAPEDTPELAEDIVSVPAAAIEPAPEEPEPEPERRERGRRRRHRR